MFFETVVFIPGECGTGNYRKSVKAAVKKLRKKRKILGAFA